jgi:hypothetical protein
VKLAYHVMALPKLIVQGLEQPVVAEPGVGDRYNACMTKCFGKKSVNICSITTGYKNCHFCSPVGIIYNYEWAK